MKLQPEFLKDVARHEMQILRDDGLYRHVRFRRPNSLAMYFDFVTWPGALCYCGDMGAYVFQRVPDMFDFFKADKDRNGELVIDGRYWAEKCEAKDSRGYGLYEFDDGQFREAVHKKRLELLAQYGGDMSASERKEMCDSLQDVIVDCFHNGETFAWARLADWYFETGGKRITLDLSEFPSCKRFSFRFEWCCQALAWGVDKYYEAKKAQEPEPEQAQSAGA